MRRRSVTEPYRRSADAADLRVDPQSRLKSLTTLLLERLRS